jgi:hypothetical protein
MTYNEWCLFVAFGSKCDRVKIQSFIEKYENYKFMQQAKK